VDLVQGDELLTLKNTLLITFVVFLFSAFGLVAPAHAYQAATINNEFAQVKQTADPNSATTSTLAKGTRVNTSERFGLGCGNRFKFHCQTNRLPTKTSRQETQVSMGRKNIYRPQFLVTF
jgi:cell division protein FtsL